MKKLLILMLIVLMAQPVFGAFTTSIDTKRTYKNAYRWTGKPKDKLLLWAKEVEDRFDSTTTAFGTLLYLTPTTAYGTPLEGMIYYDSSANKLKFYDNTAAWITIEAASGNSLDSAYDSGQGITLDNGSVTLTATDSANNIAFAGVQSDAASAVAQTITSAGTGALLTFTSNGTGADILGTGSTWTVTKAGASTFDGLTITTADATWDATSAGKDLEWDDSRFTLHFLDDTILGIGGATTEAADFTFIYDGTDLNMEAAAAEDMFRMGEATNFDFVIHGGTNTNEITFDTDDSALLCTFDGFDLVLNDGDFVEFGDDLDFKMTSDATAVFKLTSLATDESPIIHIGADQAGIDVRFYPATTAEYMEWDAGNEALECVGTQIHLDDTSILQFGTDKDFTIYSDTASTLEFDPKVAGDQIKFGTSNTDAVDMTWYSDFSGSTVIFDEENVRVDFGTTGTGVAVHFWGATASQQAWWDEQNDTWYFGDDAEGVDVIFNGDNTGNYIIWDENLDTMVHVGGHEKYDDDAIIYFGTGTNITTADGDFSVNFTDGSPGKLVWTSTADDQFIIGDGTIRTDFVIDNATTATNDVWFDAAGDTNKGVWYFGVDNEGVDVFFYGATTTQFMQFDADADEFLVDTIKVNIMDDTLLTFGDADDVTMNYDEDGDNDLQVTGPVSFEGTVEVTGLNNTVVVVTDAATYSVLVANTGKLHVITDLAQNCLIKLPVEAAGLYYKFIYTAAAAEGHTHTIASENDTNYLIGGVAFADIDAGAGADEIHAGVYSNGSSNSKISLIAPAAGTTVELYCNGTQWYITGIVFSATIPTIANN